MIPTVITASALVERLNCRLVKEHTMIRRSYSREFGSFYAIDYSTGILIERNVNIEKLGRELGVLGSSEEVYDPPGMLRSA